MASLSSLPNELLITIIEYLRPNNDDTPIIGVNSTWKRLSAFRKSLEIDQLSAGISQLDLLKEENSELSMIYSPLNAFRLTCSLYNELCKPIIYQECNLIDSYPTEQAWSRCLLNLRSCSQHVRSIRLQTNKHCDETLASALSLCRNATSIGIYYHANMYKYIHCIKECIMDLFENGNLDSLGIYWNRLLDEGDPPYTNPNQFDLEAIDLLYSIAQNPKTRKSIINLDLAIPSLSEETYDLIRSDLTSLQSFTVRRALRDNLPRIWDFPSSKLWYKNPNLTRLQILDCHMGYSAHIPHLVRHFVGLQYLSVSTCGHWTDVIVNKPLPKERYSQPDALCKVRKPLKSFHIEHMEDWEIAMMGDIPTETLLITNTGGIHLEAVFKADRDLFPSLRLLRLESQHQGVGHTTETISILNEVCELRGIELRQDARRLLSFSDHDRDLGLNPSL